ncbi:unnamed protein product [Danaus chrysippus]|uniref:(African queen) hypothetical protein n=1 Tax=Danaus chrysippus TaxID=151541 RepID=A0A8J2QMX6_9NEOP|nr:unnamed protein product [Danaus chrysippus]
MGLSSPRSESLSASAMAYAGTGNASVANGVGARCVAYCSVMRTECSLSVSATVASPRTSPKTPPRGVSRHGEST